MKPATITSTKSQFAQILCSIQLKWSFVCLVGIVALLCGCGKPQESARKELAKLGKDFSPAVFLNCVRNGDSMALRLFIEAGMDVNKPDENGFTPLMIASWYGNADVAKLLIERGANLNAIMDDGRSALQIAKEHQHPNIVEMLSKGGAKDFMQINKQFAVAVINCITNEVISLLAQGADPNILFSTIVLNDDEHPHMIDLLRDHTALTVAVWGNHPEIVSILLDKGADPTKPNGKNQYPDEIARRESPASRELLQKASEARNRR
jgi:ankyrin repeat protein